MEKSPDAFRTISEVAELLETPAHVLRFWESRFPQIRPVKRAGGRRYYRPADVALLTGIKRLLHDEGLTIRGVQKILREQGVRHVSGMADETSGEDDDAALEAALLASSGGDAATSALPPAEAESAQVIALEQALEDRSGSKDAGRDAALNPSETDEDRSALLAFSPAEASPSDEEPVEASSGRAKAADDDGISDLVSRMVAASAPEDTPAPSSDPGELRLAEAASDVTEPGDDAAEAPMALWAEDEAEDEGEDAPSQHPAPSLRVTRIGAARLPETPAPAPSIATAQTTANGPEPEPRSTLAARLRHTRAADLSASDRNAISVIRARARTLRDRLAAPIRPGP